MQKDQLSPSKLLKIGNLFRSNKKVKQAIEIFKKYIEYNPDCFKGYYNVASCCCELCNNKVYIKDLLYLNVNVNNHQETNKEHLNLAIIALENALTTSNCTIDVAIDIYNLFTAIYIKLNKPQLAVCACVMGINMLIKVSNIGNNTTDGDDITELLSPSEMYSNNNNNNNSSSTTISSLNPHSISIPIPIALTYTHVLSSINHQMSLKELMYNYNICMRQCGDIDAVMRYNWECICNNSNIRFGGSRVRSTSVSKDCNNNNNVSSSISSSDGDGDGGVDMSIDELLLLLLLWGWGDRTLTCA